MLYFIFVFLNSVETFCWMYHRVPEEKHERKVFYVYLFPFNVFSCVVGSQGPCDINLTKKQQ